MSPTGVILGFCVWRLVYAIYKTFDEYHYVAHLYYTREILATTLVAFVTGPIGMLLMKWTDLGFVGVFFLYLVVIIGLIAIMFSNGTAAYILFFWL